MKIRSLDSCVTNYEQHKRTQLKQKMLKTKSESVNKDLLAFLTLAVLGEDTGGNATDILSTDAGVMNLHFHIGQ